MKKMKKIMLMSVIIALVIGCISAQQNTPTPSQQEAVDAMGAVAYNSNNSDIYNIDIIRLIKSSDSVFVGADTLEKAIIKKTIIVFKQGPVKEIYATSNFVKSLNDSLYVEYMAYVDKKYMVHELFLDNPKDKEVLCKLSAFLRDAKCNMP